jgi:molybdopterin molybdotransferase
MISVDAARQTIQDAIAPLAPIRVPLAESHGRVLAEEIVAHECYPAVDRSMMDGYAVVADDPAEKLCVVGEVQAGDAPAFQIVAGQCARIFTGAPLPAGASQVIPQEDVRREGDWVWPTKRTGRSFVRRAGEEARPGDVLLSAGTWLGGPELAVLAQIGAVRPLVHPGPSVRHVATGSELVPPEVVPAGGQIRDTNSSLIATLLVETGAGSVQHERCGDDLDQLVANCRGISTSPDLLLISGGASVGDYDFGARALRELGYTIHFDRVNLRPGKPLIFATRGAQAAFVIPGNPVSHFVCFHVAIRFALERMRGARPAWDFLEMELGGGDALRGDPRETFWPAEVVVRDGRLLALPKRWSSSGDTFALAGTNALIRIAANCAPVEQGGRIPALLLAAPGA